MVQRTGSITGLITTRGFEDTLVIGRVKSRWVGLEESQLLDFKHVERPAPVVPSQLVRGVTERIDSFGKVVVPLDLKQAERQLDELVARGVQSLAISLLWSFKNPSHETAIAQLAREKYPSLYVVASSELVPAMGEYERTNTTAVDAYLGPTLRAYLSDIEAALKRSGYQGEVLVMQSTGGLAPASGLMHAAVTSLHSGPAGGIVAAQKLGESVGEPRLITADMGGTTCDVGLVVDGRPQTSQMTIMERNLLLIPAVDVISIGAGGGSIAWLDSAQALHVGPRSQGSRPGPACYDWGGDLPTVTDADVVLGYINPDSFLGGRMRLRADLARDAIRRHVAEPMGTSVEAAAQAIYEIVNAHMADLVRSVSVGRGYDPREFAMVAFGGCGPTHATGFGPECQVGRVIVPFAATVFSALGIAQSDIKHHFARTFMRSAPPAPEPDSTLCAELNGVFAELQDRADAQLERDGVPPPQRSFHRSVDLRYRKQVHELTIPIGVPGPVRPESLSALFADFHKAYDRLYGAGSSMEAATIELVTVRLDGAAKTASEFRPLARQRDSALPADAIIGERRVWWKHAKGYAPTPTYQWEKLRAGNVIAGPAVIESYGTTIPLHAGQQAELDVSLNLVLNLGGSGAGH